MKRAMCVVSLVAAVLLLTVVPSLAGGRGGRGHGRAGHGGVDHMRCYCDWSGRLFHLG